MSIDANGDRKQRGFYRVGVLDVLQDKPLQTIGNDAILWTLLPKHWKIPILETVENIHSANV